jgi:glutathione S-transferase
MTTILHGFPLSANTYRVRLLLNLLSVPHELRKVDLLQGEHKRPPFRALHPLGLVPVLEDQGRVLWDSHALLVYLAEKYGPAFLPDEARPEILQWLFFDATELHHGIGLARNHFAFRVPLDVAPVLTRARAALDVMNARLSERAFLELDRATLADVACYPFIAVLPEAGLDPEAWPHVISWARRIEALPGFVPMPRLPGAAR